MYGGETSVGKCILGDSLEKPRSDLLVHTLEVCKVPTGTDKRVGHDLWVKCTMNAECQPEHLVMLTDTSGMDPRMISQVDIYHWKEIVEFLEVKGDQLHFFPFEKLLSVTLV